MTIKEFNVRRAVFDTLTSENFEKKDLSAYKEEDRSLYNEIVTGVLRELRFLDYLVSGSVKKMPRPKMLWVLRIFLYQLLFLDRIPKHAVFSEMKKLATVLKFSPMEIKFSHGVLENIFRAKEKIFQKRQDFLSICEMGKEPGADIKYREAVFNLPHDVILKVLESAEKLDKLPGRAWMAMAALKKESILVGWLLPNVRMDSVDVASLESSAAPFAVAFPNGQTMRSLVAEEKAWIQGEGSQWACEAISRFIKKRIQSGVQEIKVLEIGAGKGGKTLGTFMSLYQTDPEILKKIKWCAVDVDPKQQDFFDDSVSAPLKKWNADFEYRIWDFLRSKEDFDFGDADIVWIDAPCSGLGTLSKHPEIAGKVTAKALEELAEKQVKLLNSVKKYVKNKGYLVLSLCTLTSTECVDTVHRFSSQNENYELVAQKILWPGTQELETTDGFFLGVFQNFKA